MSLEFQQIFDNSQMPASNSSSVLNSWNFSSPFHSADLSQVVPSNNTNNSILPAHDLLSQLYGSPFTLGTINTTTTTAAAANIVSENKSSGGSETTILSDHSHSNQHDTNSRASSSSICSKLNNSNSSSSSSACAQTTTKQKRKRTSKNVASNTSSPNGGVAKRGRRISSNSTLPCPVCQQTYSRKDNLRAHMRVHSGEKPYKCSNCSESFRWLGALRKHKATNACNINILNSNSLTAAAIDSDNSSLNTKIENSIDQTGFGQVSSSNFKEEPQLQEKHYHNIHNNVFSTSNNGCNDNSALDWSPEKSSDAFLTEYAFSSETWSLPELNSNLLSIPAPST